MTFDDIDADYRATRRAQRKNIFWAFSALVGIVAAGAALLVWLTSPSQTVDECIEKNVTMYVENQSSHGRPATELGRQAARDQAQHGCERFSNAG